MPRSDLFDGILTANPVFYRTYSRRTPEGGRETWAQTVKRSLSGLVELGGLTEAEEALLERMMLELKSLPSGRWLWVGGTPWLAKPENFSGAYNCTSTNVIDWSAFGLMMDLAMMGCGTGAVLESSHIDRLPVICNPLDVAVTGKIGEIPACSRQAETTAYSLTSGTKTCLAIAVGDSRQGWVAAYQKLLELASDPEFVPRPIRVYLGHVRPAGERLNGFGGIANPVKLPGLFPAVASILNGAIGRRLNAEECCLLIDRAAEVVVAGNVRRSAGIRQFDASAPLLKENLWQPDENGNWHIDPARDALRMANHTRVFHERPTLEAVTAAVRKQYQSGEGAIQWAGEAVARGSADLWQEQPEQRSPFIAAYAGGKGQQWLQESYPQMPAEEIEHRLQRYGLNPCITADTWILTTEGPRQVYELLGVPHETIVDGYSYPTTGVGFFHKGYRPVIFLETKEGFSLKLTADHKVQKVIHRNPLGKAYVEWVAAGELYPGNKILLHNHRGVEPWPGPGTADEGYYLGRAIALGNGNSAEPAPTLARLIDQWEDFEALPESNVAIALAGRSGEEEFGAWAERGSYDFCCGFLQGLFDLGGQLHLDEPTQQRQQLQRPDETMLAGVQRMLARLGIISHRYGDTLTISGDNLQFFYLEVGTRLPGRAQALRLATDLTNSQLASELFEATVLETDPCGEEEVYDCTVPLVHRFCANGIVAHNCGEIIGSKYHCNLAEVHLNQLDPQNFQEQEDAFRAGAIAVASLLHHQFAEPRYQRSRELDPIVGVSFTGLFDFFVKAFGADWLEWWAAGRPDYFEAASHSSDLQPWAETNDAKFFRAEEIRYLARWREIVHEQVWEYCDRHGLKRPNRCTTVQPAGTKSLLTGASPGWHPPKAARFIRRITFAKGDPVALACIDYGYSVVPSQSDKDESGNLLTDPFDPRCMEWLVEIPVAVAWADMPGCDAIDLSQFFVAAQFDFCMQVQRHYVTHNTSATLELRENEIEELGALIHQAIEKDEGYISAAILARFDDRQTFPRLPFEPISRDRYAALMGQVAARRKTDDFHTALLQYDTGDRLEAGPAGCDSDLCLLPEKR